MLRPALQRFAEERRERYLAAATNSFNQVLEIKPGHLEARRARDNLDGERTSIATRLKRLFRLK